MTALVSESKGLVGFLVAIVADVKLLRTATVLQEGVDDGACVSITFDAARRRGALPVVLQEVWHPGLPQLLALDPRARSARTARSLK